MDQDEREKRARELYERVCAKQKRAAPPSWGTLTNGTQEHYRTLVDVIGEIERERHPLYVLTVAPDGSQTVRVVPEGKPLTEAEARAWAGKVLDDVKGQAMVDVRASSPIPAAVAAVILASNRGEIPPEVRLGVSIYGNPHDRGCAHDVCPRRPCGGSPLSACEAAVGAAACGCQAFGVPVTDLARAHLRPERWSKINMQGRLTAERPRDHVEPEDVEYTIAKDDGVCGVYAGRRPKDLGAWVRHDEDELPPLGVTEDRTPEQQAAYGDWHPKVGDRVRTVETLTACKSYREPHRSRRRANAPGLARSYTFPGYWDVVHDDGTEAPYDADELRPEPQK
jgi:hypothetical protein